jgi:phosphate transport system permease protein
MSITLAKRGTTHWVGSGAPWIWLNAGAIALCMIMVIGLLGLIAVRGFAHFWPAEVLELSVLEDGATLRIIGEPRSTEMVPAQRLEEAGVTGLPQGPDEFERLLLRVGNRDSYGADFRNVLVPFIVARSTPAELVAIERREWGNQYGYLRAVKEGDRIVAEGAAAWPEFQVRLAQANALQDQIDDIQKDEIGRVNHRIERLRLRERRLELDGELTDAARLEIAEEKALAEAEFGALRTRLTELVTAAGRDSYVIEIQDGQQLERKLALVVGAIRPNQLGVLGKLGVYFSNLWGFLTDPPREANTEGGILPAIFGTVMMVIIMSILVTPFGVIAAVYLREYAKQNALTRIVRIAVNNLAGVPSIVFGVFGLGFFVYIMGAGIDEALFPEALPAPTFGTPGLIWASLTLALLTLPVVIVATEEGLARIPRSVREGSYALGATQAETLWRIVLPMASPAMMTGLILAVARAAGEVAPLMLVGVVKLAPTLPVDMNAPFVHLERKFMHLGFHIYDVGFQSPNVEAARPLVYATAAVLVLVIVMLNLAAVRIRNQLREKYKALE